MKFRVNAAEFLKALEANIEVSTKNPKEGIDFENIITIKSDKEGIVANSYGGHASILAEINDKYFSGLAYENYKGGEASFNAKIMKESLYVFNNDEVIVELESNQLKISLCSDDDFVQCVPTYDMEVIPPVLAKDFSIESEFNREVLVEGIKKVQFAVGFEETQVRYMYLVINVENKGVRFIAGTGKYFAISKVEGKVSSGDKNDIFIPHHNISSIVNILSQSSAKMISIKYTDKDDPKSVPAQIVLQFDNNVLRLFGMNSNINYPDIDSILDFDYPNKIYSDIKEWKRSVSGVGAADMGNINAYSVPNTGVYVKGDVVKVETKGELKSKSKISIDKNNSVIKDNDPWFKCNSAHLKNLVSRSGIDSGNVIVKFEDQGSIGSKDNGRIEPILVEFPDNVNSARNTVEKFKLFFIASTS